MQTLTFNINNNDINKSVDSLIESIDKGLMRPSTGYWPRGYMMAEDKLVKWIKKNADATLLQDKYELVEICPNDLAIEYTRSELRQEYIPVKKLIDAAKEAGFKVCPPKMGLLIALSFYHLQLRIARSYYISRELRAKKGGRALTIDVDDSAILWVQDSEVINLRTSMFFIKS